MSKFIGIVFLLLLSNLTYGQTAGDDCSSAPNIVANGLWNNFGLNTYTASGTLPLPTCPIGMGYDAWVKVDVPSSGNLALYTNNSFGTTFDLSMAVYSGSCSSLTLIRCNEDDGFNRDPFILLKNRTAGETIYIRIWSKSDVHPNTYLSSFRLDLMAVDPTTPSNDNCASPKMLTVGTYSNCLEVTDTITYATSSGETPTPTCGSFGSGKDLWYSVVVPANGNIAVSSKNEFSSIPNDPIASNINLVAYNGTCGNLTEISCNSLGEINGATLILNNQSPNDTILVRVWEDGSNEIGRFNICAYGFNQPVNDECTNAKFVPITTNCTSTTAFKDSNLSGATRSTGILPCNAPNTVGGAVWYKTVIPLSGNLSVELPPIMNCAVYTNNCSALNLIGCMSQNRNITLENLAPNDTVLIRVWPGYGTIDNLQICATDPIIPSNNNCSAPLPLNVGQGYTCNLIRENLRYSTPSDLATDSCSLDDKDLWYSVIVPSTGSFYIQRSDSNHFLVDDYFSVSVYHKSDCDTLLPILCNTPLPYPRIPASSGGNYSGIHISNLNPSDTLLIRLTKVKEAYSPFGHSGFAMDQEVSLCLSELVNSFVPVLLNNFRGIKNQESNQLLWETFTEINANKFEIERSNDNKRWSKIGEVLAKGNSNSKTYYSFTDQAPLQDNYYRLKMIDADYTFEYSSTIHLKRNVQTKLVSIFPNPAQEYFTLNIRDTDEITSISLYSGMGEKIRDIKVSSSQIVDLNNLSTGIYILKMVTISGVQNIKVIKR